MLNIISCIFLNQQMITHLFLFTHSSIVFHEQRLSKLFPTTRNNHGNRISLGGKNFFVIVYNLISTDLKHCMWNYHRQIFDALVSGAGLFSPDKQIIGPEFSPFQTQGCTSSAACLMSVQSSTRPPSWHASSAARTVRGSGSERAKRWVTCAESIGAADLTFPLQFKSFSKLIFNLDLLNFIHLSCVRSLQMTIFPSLKKVQFTN